MFVFTHGMMILMEWQKQDFVQKKRQRRANGLDDDAAEGTHRKSDQSKIRGASLTEMFTPCQLEAHVAILKQWVGETKPKVDEKRAMGECKNDYACQLCGVEKLFFAIGGCFLCRTVFKKMDTYRSASKFGVECRICSKCLKKIEGEKLSVSGLHISKENISLDIDPLYQEPFVQCDRCDRWQHHTCALFNNERNIGGKAEYICPKCYIQDIKNGILTPLDQSVIRGATDLPRTKLSDFMEGRLFSRLKKERYDRAKGMGKNPEEVPGAEDLVVRVVLSVDKRLLVQQELLNVFKEENYPKELPYRSKTIAKQGGSLRAMYGLTPPSVADDDYIFNCHPEIQKSPKVGYLRDWYRKVLRKAASEKIVASVTNLYDHFFVPHGEHKVTADRLPYFDGDYWLPTAEALLKKLADGKLPPVRKARKQKPSFEADGCTDASRNSFVDNQLMQELGKGLWKLKENFIVVHLETQHMAEETDSDEEEVIEGSLFDGKDNFMDFCVKNQYQFDNLGRAKHSSMMILYYLHYPSAYTLKRTSQNVINPGVVQQVGTQG
ncbi:probable histone acetyltransferase HAC-like 1 [Papaver somniferum]|uniref:probable histone acetyltransferase HAC-like 1 n=1 Tax=Papaver somniferum TaxID=3469 RepID=UPI000E70178C|nr:probable histone acetyltransferase HAC-like 1 [Papaver somniferum]